MNDYLSKINELVSQAMQAEREEGKKEAASEYEAQIEQYKSQVAAAYEKGYQKGLADAEVGQPVVLEPQDPEDVPTFKLTNDAVAAFMSHEYPDDILLQGASVVNNYCIPDMHEDDYEANWQEHPLPVEIGTSADDVVLTLEGKTRTVKGGKIYNLIPGKEYAYVLNGKSGKFRTTGTMRQIHFSAVENHINNCRDIGDGKTIAYGRIIRSGYIPAGLKSDDENARIMREDVGITAEIDFQKTERNDLGWKVYEYSIYSYAYVLTTPKDMKKVFTTIANELSKGGCVLIHCYAGADRTGTIIALILAVLGASQSYICHDYEGTCFPNGCNFKRIDDERFDEFKKGELRSLFKALMKTYGKSGESLQEAVYKFLTTKVGVSKATIETLKKELLIN